jgi:hypothetical protein
VNSSAQAAQNFCGMIKIGGLADNFIIEPNQRIGREDDRIWAEMSDRPPFADRIKRRQLAQGKIDIEPFANAGRHAFEFKTTCGKQLTAAR